MKRVSSAIVVTATVVALAFAAPSATAGKQHCVKIGGVKFCYAKTK